MRWTWKRTGGGAHRYGRGTTKLQADGGPKLLDHFLVARLIETGVQLA
ncbi:MAG: hypothetical protein R3C12_24120 [Planctomycetaceae bacterium]